MEQALDRQGGIDGSHGRTRARDRPEPDRARERSRCGQGDHGARPGAARTEYGGQPSRLDVEPTIGQVPSVLGDRDATGIHGDRRVQQVGQCRPRRGQARRGDHRAGSVVPGGQVTHRQVRVDCDGSREGDHPTEECVHGVGVEQCGRVGDDHAGVVVGGATRFVEDGDLQVDLGRGDRSLDLGDDETR